MLRLLHVIFLKEAREALRDRRSAVASLGYALLGPVVLLTVLMILERNTNDAADIRIRLVGADAAPGLARTLAGHGIIASDSAAIVLDVPEDFAAALVVSGRPSLVLEADLAKRPGAINRVRAAVAEYSDALVTQRLLARGIAPEAARPLRLDLRDTASLDRASRLIADAVLFILLAAPFFAGISIASDSTAGERERHSLVPLLQQPVAPAAVILGKWLAISTAALSGTAATVVGTVAVLRWGPAATFATSGVNDGGQLTALVVSLVPLSLSAASLQLLLSLGSRTYKEGQTYLTLLTLAPFAAMMLARSPAGIGLLRLPIPFLWEVRSVERILTGEPVGMGAALLCLASYAILTGSALVAATRMLERAAIRED